MTDTTDYMAQIAEARQKQEAALAERRKALLAALRAAGATRVIILYDGYGDSGDVNDVTIEPETVALGAEDAMALAAFGWDRAYALHPGFENNEGGNGEIAWDIATDTMSLTHNDCVMDYDTTEHEEI
ncbi:MAG: hypothetical protein JJ911_19110 [Rhizobiaceae bacterium]|nr:hypothetical protein [Rhizobiaceae bacterium]